MYFIPPPSPSNKRRRASFFSPSRPMEAGIKALGEIEGDTQVPKVCALDPDPISNGLFKMGNNRHLGLMCIMSTRQKKLHISFTVQKLLSLLNVTFLKDSKVEKHCAIVPSVSQKVSFLCPPMRLLWREGSNTFYRQPEVPCLPNLLFPISSFLSFLSYSRICFPIRSTFVRSARDHLYYYFVTTGELTCEERK